jgi:hypothetical protein
MRLEFIDELTKSAHKALWDLGDYRETEKGWLLGRALFQRIEIQGDDP